MNYSIVNNGYLFGQVVNTNTLSELVCVSAGDIGRMFCHMLKTLEPILADPSYIMQTIIESISHKDSAYLELSYRLLEEARNVALEQQYAVAFLNCTNAFGVCLIDTLTYLGMYKNGYLQYTYHSISGSDIVFVKIDLPSNPNPDRLV